MWCDSSAAPTHMQHPLISPLETHPAVRAAFCQHRVAFEQPPAHQRHGGSPHGPWRRGLGFHLADVSGYAVGCGSPVSGCAIDRAAPASPSGQVAAAPAARQCRWANKIRLLLHTQLPHLTVQRNEQTAAPLVGCASPAPGAAAVPCPGPQLGAGPPARSECRPPCCPMLSPQAARRSPGMRPAWPRSAGCSRCRPGAAPGATGAGGLARRSGGRAAGAAAADDDGDTSGSGGC